MKRSVLLFVLVLGCGSEKAGSGSASAGPTGSSAPPTSAPAPTSQGATSALIASAASASAPVLSEKEQKLATLAVMDAFVDACSKKDIKLEKPEIYDEKTDPNKLLGRPHQYLQKMNWKIGAKDASVEIFINDEDMNNRADYIEGLGKKASMFAEYIYRHPTKHFILRLPHQVEPDKAKEWETLFLSI